MAWGVPWDYLVFCICISPLLGTLLNLFFAYVLGIRSIGLLLVLGIFACLVLYGKIKAKDDPEFFSIHLAKINKMPKTKGNNRGNVYHP